MYSENDNAEEEIDIDDCSSEVSELTRMNEELEQMRTEIDQFRAMAQRSQADLTNYKRRSMEELVEARRSGNAQLLLKMLSVVDDMDRAISLVPEDAVATGWLEGLILVQRNLANLLDSQGVSKIEARGQPFEPWEHEALLYEEDTDSPSETVIRVIRDGYKFRDQILRPAQVVVSRTPEPETDDQEEG